MHVIAEGKPPLTRAIPGFSEKEVLRQKPPIDPLSKYLYALLQSSVGRTLTAR